MRTHTRARFLGLLLAGMLACAPMPLMAAVYKCVHNGQTTYSESPCTGAEPAMKPGVVVVPSTDFVGGEKKPRSAKGVLSSLGLDTGYGVIGLLLFGIPLSIVLIFFLTRKSEK